MKTKLKKTFLVLLSVCMVMTMMPSAVFAAEGDVAQIGDQTYATLDEAVEAAEDGATIELLADATTNGLNLSKNLTITSAEGLATKPTVTFTQYGIALWGKSLTFQNCNIVMNGIGSTPYTGEWNWMTICASVDASLTLDNVEMTMDAAGTTNSPHAIYFCNNNVLNLENGTVLTIKNYANDALEWNEGNGRYNVNITDSTFISDHNRSGFTGTFYATITNSDVDVINSTGNGSNGSHFIIKNSDVNFSNNGSHGLSAGELSIDHSTVTTENNKGMGITVNNGFTVQNDSVVTVNGNAENTSYGYAAVRLYNNFDFTVDSTSKLYIKDNNNTGLYVRQGNLTVEEGATLEITGNEVTHNLLDGYGGGIYVGYGDNYDPTVILPADAVIYNNHALAGGDDIYVSEGVNGPSLTFGKVGEGWALDGDPDCTDAIDGWYDDSEGKRWEAHTEPYHAQQFTEFETLTGMTTVNGLTSLKAAHGLKPLEPGEESGWEISKSKTATNLDSSYESDVTLSLPSAEEQLVSDVVFVLDESSCTQSVKEAVREMLSNLYTQIEDTGASIKIGAVQFRGEVTEFPLKELNESTKDEIFDFMNSRPETGGSNMSAGLLAGKRILDQDESVDNNRKYLILVSDGITYIWDDETTEAQENYGVNFANGDAPDKPMLASPDSWDVKYGSQYVPVNWLEHLNVVSELLSNTIQDKSSVYERDVDIIEKPFVGYSEKDSYVSSVDIALYKSYQIYQDISSEYRTYAVMAGEESDIANYPFGPSFMDCLSNGEKVTFETIQNDIYYLLDAGSRIVDVIGEGTDDKENKYNFDFVEDVEKLRLTVGEEELSAAILPDPQFTDPYVTSAYGFGEENGSKDGTTYPFILNYYEQGEDGASEECFVWEINVPVSNFAPVQLTYTVKLTNPQTSSGTYGRYDADGSEGYTSLYTNNSAVLYPVDSNGEAGVPESFAKPTVSYTVSSGGTGGGGGSRPNDPPELNTDDHYAYVIGYPEDYRTGEATDDESLWPVKPQNNITRAEVATIFFRMLTDESRSDYWMQTNPYSDVDSDMWYNNAISTLTNAGILTGYEDGSFRPNDPITRAEFAAMTARFSDTEYSGDNSFSDVSDSYWAARYIALAEYLGWINGYPDGTFRPAQNITRAESMTLVNAVLERTPDADHMLDDMITWPDNEEGAWYYEAVQEATNSHSYEREDNESPETWLEILEVRSWADLEKEWSDANSSDNPGDVMGK